MMQSMEKRQAGFSLVELMIGLAAGLIVSGAVIAFTLVSLQTNTEYVQATRLTQELRASLDLIGKEFARAGYDETAVGRVMDAASATASPFAPILVSPDPAGTCVIYAYDRQVAGATAGSLDLAHAEQRGIRRVSRTVGGVSVGVIEFAESSATVTPSCGGGSPDYTKYPPACGSDGWCALSDPRVVDITQLTMTVARSTVASNMQTRIFTVAIQGSPVGDASVVRGLRSTIKVNAPCLRTTIAQCNAAPASP